MISLEGLALVTGRHDEAQYILQMFAHFVQDGFIPNLFPERRSAGLYHTADASVVFPRRESVHRIHGRRGHPRLAPAYADRYRRPPRARDFLRQIGVESGGRSSPSGRPRLPAPTCDGCEGRRPRRHAPAGKRWRSTRSTSTRSSFSSAGPDLRCPTARGPSGWRLSVIARRSTRDSGTRQAAVSTTWSTARAVPTIRRSAPTSSSPSRCRTPCSRPERWDAIARPAPSGTRSGQAPGHPRTRS